jgi:hypothetical protein
MHPLLLHLQWGHLMNQMPSFEIFVVDPGNVGGDDGAVCHDYLLTFQA